MEGEFAVRAKLALVGDDLRVEKNICINVRDGIIESITSSASCRVNAFGGDSLIVTPQPALLHTHSADHSFTEYGVDRDLESLVAPPNGLKHRKLSELDKEAIIEGILEFYRLAWRYGVGLLADFREGGGVGCSLAKEAYKQAPDGLQIIVLGRPGPEFPRGCDGLGISSPLDHSLEELRSLTNMLRPALTHVAETREAREKGDLELAIEAGFDAIIHGTHLTEEDLMLIKTSRLGLVLCPRSNLWHGIGIPPVYEALKVLDRIGLGSDNAAWMTPNIWREIEIAVLIARSKGPVGEWLAKKILRGVFVESYKIMGSKPRIIEEGEPANFLVFNTADYGFERAESIYYALTKRLGGENLVARIDGGEISFL